MIEKIADSKSVPAILRYLGTWALVGGTLLAASMIRDLRDVVIDMKARMLADAAANTVRWEQYERDRSEASRRLALLEQKSQKSY